ncbi:MAG: dipeptidase [Alphaproteobacteria bacterium]|nr:dipeptidase [Alphaproteobacteria bacterium]
MSGWLADNRERVFADLTRFLSIASISTDPQFKPKIADAQRFLLAHLEASRFENRRLIEGDGHAAVYADWLHAPGKPTLLVYGHYDVQPPDPLEAWTSPPFTPTVRDGRLYARGASDDKCPLFVALTAASALLAADGALPVNLKLLIEGEEEVGSKNLESYVRANRALLAADFVLSADGARWRADLPAVNVASRGIATLEFALTTAAKDLHSGRYGGAVANPLNAIARLVASLHEPSGRIAVEGFYDGVAEPTNAERAAIADLPFDEAAYIAAVGASGPVGEAGYSTLERQWLRPSLDLNGLWGGYQGTGSKTVIPHEARAKLSSRLVPGQDPARIVALLQRHLETHCPPGAKVEMKAGHGSPAYALPPDHPALAVAEAVLAEVHGRRPVRVRIGATLPISDMFKRVLGIDTIMFSYSTADEDFHAPNEFFRLSSFDDGFAAWQSFLRRAGALAPQDFRAFRR